MILSDSIMQWLLETFCIAGCGELIREATRVVL